MTPTALLDRVLDPVAEAFSADVAHRLVHLQLDPDVRDELERWREGAADGSLTGEEQERYRRFVEVLDFIGILQAKARRSLASSTPAPQPR